MLDLQEQLLQAQKMESIGQLAGGIAHDFNNLLTVINGHAQLAEVNLKNGLPVNEDIQAIQEAGYKAANLTRQILAFSRKEMIQPEKIDLKETLENFINMKSMLIGEDIEFSVKLSPDLSDILADRNQFEQMIINLLVNARDAIYEYKEAAEKKQIRIESKNQYFDDSYRKDGLVQQSGRHVVISISDTGKGMDANTKRHIFDPFFTTKGPGKGTGLGLAMVYGMVKQNGGRIHVYSEPGQGTTFKIIWPVAEGEEKAPKKKISQTATSGTEKILIVEDDEAVRNFTWATLKTLGYTIFAKANAFDALDFFREHKEEVDLLITDVIMPGMNGKEMVDKMLEIKSDLKVLFTSGYTDDYIHSSGIINEGINFINKPYSTTDMAIKVRTILDN
jgi:nitrogen-specific signal transduction histidine kinase